MPAQVIHPQELKNCHYVAVTKPLGYPANPPPFHKKKTGQPLVNWLTNVAYWMTYPDAPIQIDPGQHPQWVHVWLRIQKCVGNKLGILGEPLPTPPAKLRPRFHKLKPRGGTCWTQWTNGQLFKCCESEWVPGIGTAISCEKLNPPRPTGPSSGVRRLARIVGRYGKRGRYARRYGAVGAANPVAFQPGGALSMSYRPSSSRSLLRPRFQVDYQGSVGAHRQEIGLMSFRPGQRRSLLRPQFKVGYQGSVGQTGVRAGQARGAPLRHVVAKCPPGTTKRRSDGACIPDPQQASECIEMKTGPASSQSCCKKADGYWWCQDFAGNNYRPGIDAVKIPPGMGAVVNANKQVRLGRMSFTDRRNARAASACVPACKWGHVCVAGTCTPVLRDPWGAKPAGKSKPLVIPLKDPFAVKRRRRGAFGMRR